jgi:hypothetical protein
MKRVMIALGAPPTRQPRVAEVQPVVVASGPARVVCFAAHSSEGAGQFKRLKDGALVAARRSSRVQASLARGNSTPGTQHHTAAAQPCSAAPQNARRGRALYIERGGTQNRWRSGGAQQLTAVCHPDTAATAPSRAQLGHLRAPNTIIAPNIAGARENGGERCGVRRSLCTLSGL